MGGGGIIAAQGGCSKVEMHFVNVIIILYQKGACRMYDCIIPLKLSLVLCIYIPSY